MRAPKTNTRIRQEQIAEAALKLIARHGATAFSVADVAREVGVVPAGIYRHYRSKDEVIEVALDLVSHRLLENVQIVRQQSTEPLDRLHLLLQRHIEFIRGNVAVPRVFFSEELFSGQPKRRAKVYRILRSYLNEVALLISEGQRGRKLRAEVAPETLAVMFLGIIQPAAILWLVSNGEYDLTGHAEQAWQVFSTILEPIADHRNSDTPTQSRATK